MHFPTTDQSAPNLGVTFKTIRVGAGLTVTELANRTDTSKSTVSRFESGQRAISRELLTRLLRAIADELTERSAA